MFTIRAGCLIGLMISAAVLMVAQYFAAAAPAIYLALCLLMQLLMFFTFLIGMGLGARDQVSSSPAVAGDFLNHLQGV